jgi:hypothetical protein
MVRIMDLFFGQIFQFWYPFTDVITLGIESLRLQEWVKHSEVRLSISSSRSTLTERRQRAC